MDDLYHIDDELRSIRVEQTRLRPLGLDRMFSRATEWETTTSTAPARAPSPPRKSAVYPLPLASAAPTSPLSELFRHAELIPHVLQWFERPSELAVLARVDRTFNEIALKKLYGHVWVRPWESHCEEKFFLLFRTLQNSPGLCKLVRHLDVRYFPLATRDTERYELNDRIGQAFDQMVNLSHLVWTRDKSIIPEMFQTIVSRKHLRSIEISGSSRWSYRPSLLAQLDSLEDLRVMLPDMEFREALRENLRVWSQRPQGGLKSLVIISRNSPHVDDHLLRAAAEYLKDLERMTLWGCSRATKEGVFAVLREASSIRELSLDALHRSGLEDMRDAPSLTQLETFSLSFAPPHRTSVHPTFDADDLPRLPSLPQLRSLFLTLSADRVLFPTGGVERLAATIDFRKLARLSILNLFFESTTLADLLELCGDLEELYLSITAGHVIYDSGLTSRRQRGTGANLRILHLNAPERAALSMEDLTRLATDMPSLEQVGSGNRVYEVHRRFEGDELVVELCRWSRTFTPGYFQNWRG